MIRGEFRGAFHPMKEEDLPEVLEIENRSFATPWSLRSFQNELEKTVSTCLVFKNRDRLLGYLVVWRVEDELHIANVAVHPDFRRRGVGRKLIQHAIDLAAGCRWIGLEVRASNTPALKLYKKFGFLEVGLRRNYYEREGEDAIVMVKSLVSDKLKGHTWFGFEEKNQA
jgi:ribosomal-protein-alanine N-acetyltransferase